MLDRIRAVSRRRQILWLLVARDLKVKYADSYLGYLWSVLDPLVMAVVFWFVFTQIFERGGRGAEPYIVFLLVGLLPWNWFSGVVNGATKALNKESKLIRSTSLPREIWVLRLVSGKFAEFALSLPVLVLFAAVFRVPISWYFFAFPIAMVIQAVLLVGLALMVAPIAVLVPDFERLVKICLRIGFYLTPIIYSVDNVFGSTVIPPWVQGLYALNPMAGIIDLYRAPLFPGEFVGWWLVAVSAAVSVVVFVVGWRTFARLESSVLKEL